MDDNLVERLREGATWDDDIAAADRIEELEKERDTYFAERNKFQLFLQRTHADWELEVAAVDGLNAKLAKAVEALVSLEKQSSITSSRGAACGPHWTQLSISILNTRATLAELEKPNE